MSKILIVDDNGQDRKIIERFLKKAGFTEVLTAETGEMAVEKAKTEQPDLVITDTMLPGIDGFEVCRQIREGLGPDLTKIIVITGMIDAVDAVKAKKMGADDYCVKTSDYASLIEAVKKLI
ncbi:response regulator transcription factor [Candidatus Omnitrophota bacterium]